MQIGALADEYSAARTSSGLVLLPEEVLECALRAVRYYVGYASIGSITALRATAEDPDPAIDPKDIAENTDVSAGEWAVISPLFTLYVELENAMRVEVSRAGGLEAFGRSVSEVRQDIVLMETETLPARAFREGIVTIGP